jgi:hypothetical protein
MRLIMAAHIETGTMASPEHDSRRILNHLGLVLAMVDELGIVERPFQHIHCKEVYISWHTLVAVVWHVDSSCHLLTRRNPFHGSTQRGLAGLMLL